MRLDDDATRLSHIVEAAQEAIDYAKGLDREAFQENRPIQHSIVRCLEIVGEAVSRLSPALREGCSHIPWHKVIATRNRIVHAYFDLNLDILWHTVTRELPELLADVKKLHSDLTGKQE